MTALGVITGIIMCILGVYSVSIPFKTFLGIGWLLGMLVMVVGLEYIVAGCKKEKKDVWKIICGVLITILGIIMLSNGVQRFLTDMMAVYMVGAAVLISGISQIVNGAKVCKTSKSWGVLGIVLGVLSIILALIALGHPILTMISVGYIIGFNIIVFGVDMIIASVAGKNA